MDNIEKWVARLESLGYRKKDEDYLRLGWHMRKSYRVADANSSILEVFRENTYTRIMPSSIEEGKYAYWWHISTEDPYSPKTEFYLSDLVPHKYIDASEVEVILFSEGNGSL